MYNVQCTLYSAQCTVHSVQCKVYSVHCTLSTVQRRHTVAICPCNQVKGAAAAATRISLLTSKLHTALHYTALHWTGLHCTALHCIRLQCTALNYNALHCTELCYTVMSYMTYCTLLTLCSSVQCHTMHNNAGQSYGGLILPVSVAKCSVH